MGVASEQHKGRTCTGIVAGVDALVVLFFVILVFIVPEPCNPISSEELWLSLLHGLHLFIIPTVFIFVCMNTRFHVALFFAFIGLSALVLDAIALSSRIMSLTNLGMMAIMFVPPTCEIFLFFFDIAFVVLAFAYVVSSIMAMRVFHIYSQLGPDEDDDDDAAGAASTTIELADAATTDSFSPLLPDKRAVSATSAAHRRMLLKYGASVVE